MSSEDWACKQRLESRYASNATHLPRAPCIASQRTVHGNAPLPIPTDCRNGLRTDPYLDLLAPAPADPSGPEPKKRTDVRDEAVNRRRLAEYQAAHDAWKASKALHKANMDRRRLAKEQKESGAESEASTWHPPG